MPPRPIRFPIAITMVAREMKDPISVSEFGIVADEIPPTGPDSKPPCAIFFSASARTTCPLFVHGCLRSRDRPAAILAKILENLSAVIRQRFKDCGARSARWRRKARASALILSSLPFMMFGTIQVVAPDFLCLGVWNEDLTKKRSRSPALGWGSAISFMYRLVNFRI